MESFGFNSEYKRVSTVQRLPSTYYRSLRRRVFPVSHLHWYWQPNKNIQETEQRHTNNRWP